MVTTNAQQFINSNQLGKLRQDIQKNINEDFKNMKIFQYLKAQINNDSDLSKINEKVLGILKKQNAKNVDYVNLSNGYSGVALTGIYDPMKAGGKSIDFNYAVCGNTNDKYLILGTPTITIIY